MENSIISNEAEKIIQEMDKSEQAFYNELVKLSYLFESLRRIKILKPINKNWRGLFDYDKVDNVSEVGKYAVEYRYNDSHNNPMDLNLYFIKEFTEKTIFGREYKRFESVQVFKFWMGAGSTYNGITSTSLHNIDIEKFNDFLVELKIFVEEAMKIEKIRFLERAKKVQESEVYLESIGELLATNY